MSIKKIKKSTIILLVLLELLFITSCLAAFALPWSLRNYPMQSNTTVFFVLTSDTSGHDSGTFYSALFGFILPGTAVYLVLSGIIALVYKKKILKSLKWVQISKIAYVVMQVLAIVIVLKAWRYPQIMYEISKTPVDSEFYEQNFVKPESISIKAPEKKNNLVLIFLESMESSYADIENGGVFDVNLIPNLTRIAAENVNFSENEKLGGGVNLEGTSWTVAGLLSKLTAIPYYNPFVSTGSKLAGNYSVECLPGAVSLGDILSESGYKCYFAMGSEKQFENRDSLLEQHGFTVHDIKWYKENNFIPKDYQVFWGFEDLKLYEIVKKELAEIASKDEPFVYGMLTVDSHYPAGFKCANCKDELPGQIQNVIRCADFMVNDFIEWMKTQDWWENTTVAIMGDHCYLDAPLNNFLREKSPLSADEVAAKRRFINVIINPAVEIPKSVQKFRKFSSFDMMPTILEAMGFNIENGSVAFGRSLLRSDLTLTEQYGKNELEELTLLRTVQYELLKKKPVQQAEQVLE